jgi:hypothetical protein
MIDITEADFNAWKHNPVTKVYLQYLAKYEADLTLHQVQSLRMMHAAPDPFQLGVFKGECNAVHNLANLSFGVLVDALTPPEQEETQEKED